MTDVLKLLIVDDEYLSRTRIRNFNFAGQGFEIAGEAENGWDALDKLDSLKPDIVVTDIVMPVMGGLQLLEKIQKRAHPPKVVMLTCHDDFEKVQSALRLGAQDYIVKLMLKEKDFMKSIGKVAAVIRRDRQDYKRNLRIILENLLHTKPEEYLKQYLSQLNEIGFSPAYFKIVLMDAGNSCAGSVQEQVPSFEYEIKSICSIIIKLNDNQSVMLLYALEPIPLDRFEQESEHFCSEFYSRCDNLDGCKGLVCRIVSGIAESKISRLQEAYKRIQVFEKQIFYSGIDRPIIREEPINKKFVEMPAEEFQRYVSRCLTSFENRNAADAAQCMKSWLDSVKTKFRPQPESIYSMARTLASCIPVSSKFIDSAGNETTTRQWLAGRIENAKTINEVSQSFEYAMERIKEETGYSNLIIRNEIKQALDYVNINYSKNISVKTVANYVKLSTSWFSFLFKAETRQTFGQYLIHYRINKAKSLLSCSDMSIYQISENVGIPDAHYFSRIFTKIMGQNPKEYRNSFRRDKNQL